MKGKGIAEEKRSGLFKEIYDAEDVKINCCLVGKEYPVETFMDSLTREEKVQVVGLFKLFGEKKGRIFNEQKFKKLESNNIGMIFEFKINQIRLAGFWRKGYNFNLIYGFKKKQHKWPKKDLKAMRKNCNLFEQSEGA